MANNDVYFQASLTMECGDQHTKDGRAFRKSVRERNKRLMARRWKTEAACQHAIDHAKDGRYMFAAETMDFVV